MNTQINLYTETIQTLQFRDVTDSDILLLNDFFQRYPSRSCDFSIGGVLIWKNFYDYKIAIVDGSLIIMGTWPDSDMRIFYEPRGPIPYAEYQDLVMDYCNQHNLKGFIMLPEEKEPIDEGDGRPVDSTLMQDWMEYLYDIEKFKTFAGKKMSKKRNHLNFFLNHYPDREIVEINEDIVPELISFTREFNATHDDNTARYESREIIDSLSHFRDFPYFGIAIKVNGKIAGYSFGEVIGDTLIVHAEKGNIEYGGIYQALSSRMAIAASEKYPGIKYLNREDDMGSEDLRKSKLSYHPSLFIAKRIISI